MEKIKTSGVISLAFFIAFISIYSILRIDIVIHELSHYIVGKMLGGECYYNLYLFGGVTVCKFENLTKGGLVLYSLAGIIGEFVASQILMIFPFTSAFGGYMYFNISVSNLFNAYKTDLRSIGLEFLTTPFFKIVFLLIGMIVLVSSLNIYAKYHLKSEK